MSIFKSCDIRGKFGTDLMLEHALKLGAAIAQLIGPTQIIVGGDGRLSTPHLKANLISSLVACGCHVFDIGILPTPAFYFARERLEIKPGIIVTASHNPADDNGFKIILGNLPIREVDIQQIQALMEHPPAASGHSPGKVTSVEILPEYIRTRQMLAPDLHGLRVVLDCANGMASLVALKIWLSTRAKIKLINNEVDGSFPHHPPNPAKVENLIQLIREVKEYRADLGIAYDGDADRVAFVDEKGIPLSSDESISIFAGDVLEKCGPATIIYDQKCSCSVAEIISSHGGTPIREKSGHTFIKSAFITQNAPYAGEVSGHHFFQAIHGDDGIYASMVMGKIIKSSGRSLSALADKLPSYPVTPDLRFPMTSENIDQIIAKLKTYFTGKAAISNIDGIRIEVEDGWGLARKSVTEPVITLRFEGKDEQALQRLVADFIQAAPELEGLL